MPTSREDLAHDTLAGLLWTFLGSGARGLVQLGVLAVLARVLTVHDFGIFTVALVVIGLASNLSSFGVAPAVVQLPVLERTHIRVAFTLSVLAGLTLFALVWTAAPGLERFFRLSGLSPVLRGMAWLCPLQGLAAVSEALLQRKMRFRALAAVDTVTSSLGYGAVGIALALAGFGVWTFVWACLAQAATRTAALITLQPHPITPALRRGTAAELVRFGGGVTLATICNYVATEGDNVVVGRGMGAEAVGLYGRAYQLMAMPAMFVGEILDKVLFPGLARLQHEPERLGIAYARAVALIALLVLPTSVGLIMFAPEVVRVFLGIRWAGVVAPFQVFAAATMFRTSYKISDSMARATGAVYRRAWRQAVYAVCVLVGAWAGRPWGLAGVAIGVSAAIAVNYLLMAQLSLALAHLSWRRFWAAHLPGLALAGVVGAEMAALAAALRSCDAPPVVTLAAAALAVPSTLLLLLWYAPHPFLGASGSWMVRLLVPHLPSTIGAAGWVQRLLRAGAEGV